MHKILMVSCFFTALSGCEEYSHHPTRNPQSAYCQIIENQLVTVYPSTLRDRRPPTEKAKLLRTYHLYDCDKFRSE